MQYPHQETFWFWHLNWFGFIWVCSSLAPIAEGKGGGGGNKYHNLDSFLCISAGMFATGYQVVLGTWLNSATQPHTQTTTVVPHCCSIYRPCHSLETDDQQHGSHMLVSGVLELAVICLASDLISLGPHISSDGDDPVVLWGVILYHKRNPDGLELKVPLFKLTQSLL